MADKSSVYCLGPNVVSCYKSTEEQRLNHRDRSCKTFGWIGSECTCYAPEIGWFVENMASKLPKMWSENGRMNHGKRWWASPGCNHLSGDCWLRGSVDCRKPAADHTLQTPLMYTYMLQTPLLCAPSLIIYILPNSKMYGRMVQSRRPNGRQLFWIPPPSPCHPVMGSVIGLFANRAQHGIVLVETFSVSQRVSTPFEGSHARNIFAPNGLESFCPCIPEFAFLKDPTTEVCGGWKADWLMFGQRWW